MQDEEKSKSKNGTGEIYRVIPKIMAEIGAIQKNKTNTQGFAFKYRGIDDVYNAAQSVFAKHGVFTMLRQIDRHDSIRPTKNGSIFHAIINFEVRFIASDGSSESAFVPGEAMDSGDKASNKCMSIAHKYALLTALMIPTEDMPDPDSERPEVKEPARQQARPAPAKSPVMPAPKSPTTLDAPKWEPTTAHMEELKAAQGMHKWKAADVTAHMKSIGRAKLTEMTEVEFLNMLDVILSRPPPKWVP